MAVDSLIPSPESESIGSAHFIPVKDKFFVDVKNEMIQALQKPPPVPPPEDNKFMFFPSSKHAKLQNAQLGEMIKTAHEHEDLQHVHRTFL